jgi:tetratricopeptide (TPR) repeat protein
MSSTPRSNPLASSPSAAGEPLTDSPASTGPILGDPVSSQVRRKPSSRRGDLAAWLTLGLALVSTLATVPLIWTPISLQPYRALMHAEWHLYLLGVQLLSMPVFLLVGGLPRSARGWLIFVIANLEIATIAGLSALNLLGFAAIHAMVLGLRVAILSLWLFVLIGLPVVIWRLATRETSVAASVSTTGKLWFSALVLLLVGEPSAALVVRVLDNANRLGFPASLPEALAGEVHVAFVGESTMAGFPYLKFGIPKVVGWELEQMYPNRKIVLDDVSAVGLNLRTALARLAKLPVRPQLLLLYSGHNEFFYDVEELATHLDTPWERFDGLFEWSSLFRVLDRPISRQIAVHDVDEGRRFLVDRPIASPESSEKRLARFGGQLEQLALWCEHLKIDGLWFVPAGTEADYPPNRSTVGGAPTERQREEIESISKEARALSDAGRCKEAGDKYRAALERYPDFAEFKFQRAECLVHEGNPTEAARYYAQALESDGLPVRMTAPWRQRVAEVARRHAIPVLDADTILRPHTKSGILDRSVFLDYVHPNLRGYYYLGMAAVEHIGSDPRWRQQIGPPQPPAHTDFGSAIAWAHFTPQDLALAYRRTAEADRWMMRLRFEYSRLTRDSQQYEDWNRRLQSGQIAPGQSGTEALK